MLNAIVTQFATLLIWASMMLPKTTSIAVDPQPAGTGVVAGDFECIDDTSFKHFSSETAFTVDKCPAGLCFTRNPKKKNPCIGKANAQRIDGTEA